MHGDAGLASGTGPPGAGLNFSRPRIVQRWRVSSSTSLEYSLNVGYPVMRTADWSLAIVSGFHMWYSPSRRHW